MVHFHLGEFVLAMAERPGASVTAREALGERMDLIAQNKDAVTKSVQFYRDGGAVAWTGCAGTSPCPSAEAMMGGWKCGSAATS
eukprot:359692-Chlamydomonas_euryale.AAC.5